MDIGERRWPGCNTDQHLSAPKSGWYLPHPTSIPRLEGEYQAIGLGLAHSTQHNTRIMAYRCFAIQNNDIKLACLESIAAECLYIRSGQPPHLALLINISLEPSAGSDGRGSTSASLWWLQGVISDDSNLISLRVALFNNYPKRDRISFVSRRMFGNAHWFSDSIHVLNSLIYAMSITIEKVSVVIWRLATTCIQWYGSDGTILYGDGWWDSTRHRTCNIESKRKKHPSPS